MTQTQLKQLEKSIQEIKQEMGGTGDMRPGSLSKQTRKSKDKYGEYWHLSYTHRGKGHTQYIRDAFVDQVKTETANFKRFKMLFDRLIKLSIKASTLRMKSD